MSISRITQLLGDIFNPKHNSADVSVQDQTTPPLDLYFSTAIGSTTLTSDTIVDENTIDVASVASISAGNLIVLVEVTGDRTTEKYYAGTVLSVDTLTVTLDSPINYTYSSGMTFCPRYRNGSISTREGVFSPRRMAATGPHRCGDQARRLNRFLRVVQ